MEQLRAVGNDANFWRQMYDEASDRRKRAERRADGYQARAQAAEKALARLRKSLALAGVLIAAAANGAYWILTLAGR